MTNIFFFDSDCPLCNKFIQFIISNDKNKSIKLCPLNSDFANKLLLQQVKVNIDYSTSIFFQNGKIYTYSDAILKAIVNCKGIWKSFFILFVVPKSIRNFIYNKIAKNRNELFGGNSANCLLINTEIKSRFIE